MIIGQKNTAIGAASDTAARSHPGSKRTVYIDEMLMGAPMMQFPPPSKEVAFADLTRKRDQLPAGHADRQALDRMIVDLGADLIWGRDRANGIRGVAITQN